MFAQPSGTDSLSFVEVDSSNQNDIATPEDVSNGNYELQVLLIILESAIALLCPCHHYHVLYHLYLKIKYEKVAKYRGKQT